MCTDTPTRYRYASLHEHAHRITYQISSELHVSLLDCLSAGTCSSLHITCTSYAHHMHIDMHITCTSHAYHMHITCTSHAHHMYITCTSHAHHTHITCTSQPAYTSLQCYQRQSCCQCWYVDIERPLRCSEQQNHTHRLWDDPLILHSLNHKRTKRAQESACARARLRACIQSTIHQ